ncbi:MAG: gamma-glutamyltransferase [SAR202 cluster bacterium]|nr:gamma-glutamyltransferase [SAR202 cluster bacterium]
MKFNSRRSNMSARNGMVATTQPLAAMAGLRILMEGGNAVDAAVATAAALNVVEPMSTGIGGDVFALVWMDSEKRVRALNASGRSSANASLDELVSQGLGAIPDQSPYSVNVPGAVSGWEAILDAHGRMSLADVLKPAIAYAEDGFPVSEVISGAWETSGARLGVGPAGGELLIGGRAPKTGEIMRMPELANTFRAVAEGGADAFYRGDIAERIAAFVQSQGGWLTSDDFAAHTAEWVEPISTTYRGHTVWQCPPPSQGVNTLMALNLAEGFDLNAMGFQSVDAYHHLIECIRLAFADGLHHVTDPDHMSVAVSSLLSDRYAGSRRAEIRADLAIAEVGPGLVPAHPDTVYLNCVDGDGNACSFINSLFMGFGSGLVVPGTGIALHNRGASFSLDPNHANALAPNKRPFHTLIPGLVTQDGEFEMVYGVMGAMQQAQGHLQVLVNMIDHGLSPQEALDAPRFSVRLGDGVYVEDIANPSIVNGLKSKGHPALNRTPHQGFFGSGQIIRRDSESGALTGASEPRADGAAVGW